MPWAGCSLTCERERDRLWSLGVGRLLSGVVCLEMFPGVSWPGSSLPSERERLWLSCNLVLGVEVVVVWVVGVVVGWSLQSKGVGVG